MITIIWILLLVLKIAHLGNFSSDIIVVLVFIDVLMALIAND